MIEINRSIFPFTYLEGIQSKIYIPYVSQGNARFTNSKNAITWLKLKNMLRLVQVGWTAKIQTIVTTVTF